MTRINRLVSKFSRLNGIRVLALSTLLLIPVCLAAENPDKPDFWVRNGAGTITHTWAGNDPDQALVMNMQGLKVVMQFQSSFTKGLSFTSRLFNVKSYNRL